MHALDIILHNEIWILLQQVIAYGKNRTSCGETYVVKCIGATNKMEQPCLKGKVMDY